MGKKKIVISLSAITVVAAIAIGGTIAIFNDTEISAGNIFTAGSLNLQVGDNDPTTWNFQVKDVKPGDKGAEETTVTNTGTINGYLHITFANLVNDEMGCNEPESLVESTCGNPGAGEGELAQNLDILVYLDENTNDIFDLGTDTLIYQGKARGLLQGDLFNYPLNISAGKSFRMEWGIANTVGNIIQSDKAGFDINFELTQIKKDIVGDWHFDENAGGTAYDSSGYANNGTINGAAWAGGNYNPALSFDGTNDYVVSGSSSLNPSSFTYEFWLNSPGQTCATSGGLCRVISRGSDSFETAIASGANPSFLANHLYIYLGSPGSWTDTGYVAPLDVWKFIAITYDSGSQALKVYANGAEVYTKSSVSISQSGNLYIGKRLNGPDEAFKGVIDEVKLYSRVLGASEVLANYQKGL